MTRRANGDGTIHQEKDRNRWVGRLMVDGKRHKVTARTRAEVVDKMNKLRAAAVSGEAIGDGNMTFGTLADQWAVRVLKPANLAPSTRTRQEWALELAKAELGKKRLRTIDVVTVEKALDRIAAGAHGRKLSRSSLVKVRSMMATVFDFGIRRKFIASNPARIAELSPDAAASTTRRSLTADEARTLWQAVEGERIDGLVRIMLVTGLRPGEALGLCWDAIDLDAGLLTVRRAVRLERGRAVLVDELKTSASHRTIGLGPAAVDVLKTQRLKVLEAQVRATKWAELDLVFPSSTGRPIDPPRFRSELASICKRHETGPGEVALPAAIKPNELRHSAASLMNDAGQPLESIADVLGHKNTRMLDQVYRHRLRPSADAALVLDHLATEATP